MVAQLDDRDIAQVMDALELDGKPVADDALMVWLEGAAGSLVWRYQGRAVPVQRIARDAVAAHFGFQRLPAP